MRRGDIWWVDMGKPFGSEPGLRRPVLIVQDDAFNESSIQTVVVVPMTSNLRVATAPGNVRCPARDSGLPRVSVANVSQIAAVDRRRLSEKVGRVPGRVMERVEEGLHLVLGM